MPQSPYDLTLPSTLAERQRALAFFQYLLHSLPSDLPQGRNDGCLLDLLRMTPDGSIHVPCHLPDGSPILGRRELLRYLMAEGYLDAASEKVAIGSVGVKLRKLHRDRANPVVYIGGSVHSGEVGTVAVVSVDLPGVFGHALAFPVPEGESLTRWVAHLEWFFVRDGWDVEESRATIVDPIPEPAEEIAAA
jgi:hypothetical protein